MVQHRPSKEEVLAAFRRSAILESARDVFGECGFERATIDRIARDAGVAKGTVYLYYDSKRTIYEDALNQGLAELDELLRVRVDEAPTLRAAIAAFIRTRVQYFLERPSFFRMYVAAVANQLARSQACPPEFQAMHERQTRRLQAVVARAAADGAIRRVDPATVSIAIADLTKGLIVRRLATTATPDLEGEIEQLVSMIWDGIGRRPGHGAPGPGNAGRPTGRTGATMRKGGR
jgi:AcrR family transcriptional regulator